MLAVTAPRLARRSHSGVVACTRCYRKGDETQLRDDAVLTTDEQADALGRVGISSAFTAASGRCGGGVIPKTKTRSV